MCVSRTWIRSQNATKSDDAGDVSQGAKVRVQNSQCRMQERRIWGGVMGRERSWGLQSLQIGRSRASMRGGRCNADNAGRREGENRIEAGRSTITRKVHGGKNEGGPENEAKVRHTLKAIDTFLRLAVCPPRFTKYQSTVVIQTINARKCRAWQIMESTESTKTITSGPLSTAARRSLCSL